MDGDGDSPERRRLRRFLRLQGTADRAALWSWLVTRSSWLASRAAFRREAAEAEQKAAVHDRFDDVTDAESRRVDALAHGDDPPTRGHWDTHPDDPHGFGKGRRDR